MEFGYIVVVPTQLPRGKKWITRRRHGTQLMTELYKNSYIWVFWREFLSCSSPEGSWRDCRGANKFPVVDWESPATHCCPRALWRTLRTCGCVWPNGPRMVRDSCCGHSSLSPGSTSERNRKWASLALGRIEREDRCKHGLSWLVLKCGWWRMWATHLEFSGFIKCTVLCIHGCFSSIAAAAAIGLALGNNGIRWLRSIPYQSYELQSDWSGGGRLQCVVGVGGESGEAEVGGGN